MPRTKKPRIKKDQLHAPGDIVFAKLRGYPWWPAKIQDETKVPKQVLQTKKKKKVSADASTVFFFGSLDYAFISEKLIRGFDPAAVRQGILDDKFKNKELVSALEQALDPHGLDFLFKTQKQQVAKRKKIQPSPTSNKTSPPTVTEQKKTPSAATATTPAATSIPPAENLKEHSPSPSPSTQRTLKRTMDVDAENDTSKKKRCKSTSVKSVERRPTIDTSDNRRPLSYTSKALEAACQKSPEYERHFKRIFVMRHKLQNLIYGKKPGETPRKDYPKIAAILTDIENFDITKELLKETQLGKVVRFGCDYDFGANDTYKLQERCLAIMKTWATTLLNIPGHHYPISFTKTSPAKLMSSASTSSTPSSDISISSETNEATLSKIQSVESMGNDYTNNTWLVEKEEHAIDIETTNLTASSALDTQETDYKFKENTRLTFISDINKATMTVTTTKETDDLIKDTFIAPTVTPLINNVLVNDKTPETSIPSIPQINNAREGKPLSTTTSAYPTDNAKADEDYEHDEVTSPSIPIVLISENITADIASHSSPMVSIDDNTIGAIDASPLITQIHSAENPIHDDATPNNDDMVTQKMISSGEESKSQKHSFYDMDSSTLVTGNNPVLLPEPLCNQYDNDSITTGNNSNSKN